MIYDRLTALHVMQISSVEEAFSRCVDFGREIGFFRLVEFNRLELIQASRCFPRKNEEDESLSRWRRRCSKMSTANYVTFGLDNNMTT